MYNFLLIVIRDVAGIVHDSSPGIGHQMGQFQVVICT